jgi:uncharacterized membrane protein
MRNKIKTIKLLLPLLLPLAIAGVTVIFLYLTNPTVFLLLIVYGLPPGMFAGRVVMVGFVPFIGIGNSIFALVFVDAFYSAILAWNFELLTKIPKIGKLVLKAEQKGYKALERYKWVKSLALSGVIIFVAMPFYGTNAIIGTIVGRLIGLKPLNTWIATIIGATLGAIIIAILYGMLTIIF